MSKTENTPASKAEARSKLKEYFGEDITIKEEIHFGTEFLIAQTSLSSPEALHLMDMLDEDWWLEKLAYTPDFQISFEHVHKAI